MVRRRASSRVSSLTSRPGHRSAALASLGLLVVGVGVGCGGGDADPSSPTPLVGAITGAVDDLEAELGGPQEYFEINADARLVNLFVATDGGATVTAYIHVDGELGPPAPPRDVAAGNTFVGAAIDLDPDRVLSRVASELPDSTITRFVILGDSGGAVRYEAIVQSRQGGVLAVTLAGDGAVLAVDPL